MKRIFVFIAFCISILSVNAQQLFIVYDTTNTPLQVNKINCLAKEGSTLWAGSEYGFASFNGNIWNYYLFNNQTTSYINNIYAIAIDAGGNKWIGTAGGGLGRFDGSNWSIYNVANSQLPSNIIKAIAFDSNNNMWIGTTGGLAVWDMDTTWVIYQQFSSALMSDNIECIVPSLNDTMWIGTVNGGLTRIVDTSLITYTILNNGVPDNTIQDFVTGQNGFRWLGCAAHGLGAFIYNSPPFIELSPANSDMPSYTINSLAIDTAGNVLCGTYESGLVRYLGGIYWQVFNDSTVGMPDSSINDIIVEDDGVIWLATTNRGIVRFDEPELYLTAQNYSNSINDKLEIFPNPSSDFINFNIGADEQKNFKIEIFDVSGKNIREDFIQTTNSEAKIKMDISKFSKGIYLVKIVSEINIQTGIFIKM